MFGDILKIGAKAIGGLFGGGNSGSTGKTAPVAPTVVSAQLTKEDLAVFNSNVVNGVNYLGQQITLANEQEKQRDNTMLLTVGGIGAAALLVFLIVRRK